MCAEDGLCVEKCRLRVSEDRTYLQRKIFVTSRGEVTKLERNHAMRTFMFIKIKGKFVPVL
jgi:hypothetical protein